MYFATVAFFEKMWYFVAMLKNILPTFDQLLKMYFESLNISKCSEAYEYMKAKGLSFKLRTAYNYLNGHVVPSYEKAISIVKALDIKIEEDELKKIIENSNDAKEIKSTRKKVTLYLNPKNLGLNDVDELEEVMVEKIKKRGETSLSEYIQKLVEEDLMK